MDTKLNRFHSETESVTVSVDVRINDMSGKPACKEKMWSGMREDIR